MTTCWHSVRWELKAGGVGKVKDKLLRPFSNTLLTFTDGKKYLKSEGQLTRKREERWRSVGGGSGDMEHLGSSVTLRLCRLWQKRSRGSMEWSEKQVLLSEDFLLEDTCTV